ncbi:hypothetical protein [Halopseudomonas sp.]|uniref:hypothetical protein n=1 Tax=Halopseudomonas sp. TaxID=2901191 RepID=UPI00311E980C
MAAYKTRRRWLAERWLARQQESLAKHQAQWSARLERVRDHLLPTTWEARMARVAEISDGETVRWQPREGSSSAELLVWLRRLRPYQRRWLASLLDAPSAGSLTLLEALERQQLDWRSQLNPLKTHREYAAQLATLARMLDIPAAAESAYLENEQRIYCAIDERLFGSLPLRLRAELAGQHPTGRGYYVRWWYERLMARTGERKYDLAGAAPEDWPDIPAAWLALGWLCGLRLQQGSDAGQ